MNLATIFTLNYGDEGGIIEEGNMRELKFRLWDKKFNEMAYFENWGFENEHMTLSFDLKSKATYDPIQSDIKNQELMQYTGCKDKNGKEIYEGDIVERFQDNPITYENGSKKYASWVVDFKFGGWHFDSTPNSPAISYPSFYSNAQYMVAIGNIYENPELVEG